MPHEHKCGEIVSTNSEDTHEQPIIAPWWKWTAGIGNVAVSAFGGIAGGFSGATAATAHGSAALASEVAHSSGDGLSYLIQADTVIRERELSPDAIARRQKIANTVIMLCSLAVAGKAGTDIVLDHESAPHPWGVYAASASLALNSVLMATLYRGIRQQRQASSRPDLSDSEKALIKHMTYVDIPSAVIAVGGTVAQRYGIHGIDSYAAVANGLFGAYIFRPTTANTAHSGCPHHSHSGEHLPSPAKTEEGTDTNTLSIKWHHKMNAYLWTAGITSAARLRRWSDRLTPSEGGTQKKWRRVLGTSAVAAVSLVGGLIYYRAAQGADIPILRHPSTGLPELPPAGLPRQVPQPLPHDYPPAAYTVTPGEGLLNTYRDIGLNADAQAVAAAGEELRSQRYNDGTSIIYYDDCAAEWRMNLIHNQPLPRSALTALEQAASIHK